MKLESANLLHRRNRRPIHQVLHRALQSEKARRVRTERKIEANRPDRRTVANSETDRLHHVIKVAKILLAEAQAELIERAVYVARIVEKHAAHVIAIERKA